MDGRWIAGLVVVVAAGCGSSGERPPTDEASAKIALGAQTVKEGAERVAEGARAGSRQMAEGLQQMARGLQQMARESVPAVDYEVLKGVLPDVDGWTKSDPRGEQMTAPVSFSKAQARYERGDARIELEITDTTFSPLLLAPLSMFLASGYTERSDDGFRRATTIGGQPGFEEWRSQPQRGEITAVAGSRFVVRATGRNVGGIEPVRTIVEAVDLKGLAALK